MKAEIKWVRFMPYLKRAVSQYLSQELQIFATEERIGHLSMYKQFLQFTLLSAEEEPLKGLGDLLDEKKQRISKKIQ